MQLTPAAVLIGMFAFVSSGVADEPAPDPHPTSIEALEVWAKERGALSKTVLERLHPSPDCVWDRFDIRYCGPGDCLIDDRRFARCANEEGGGIALDYTGAAVCGPGACLAENTGEVYCSKARDGYAWYDRFGTVDCTAGCVRGDADACVEGRVDDAWTIDRRTRPVRMKIRSWRLASNHAETGPHGSR